MEKHYPATTTSPPSRHFSISPSSLSRTTSSTSKRSSLSLSTKSPGSSPRSPVLFSTVEPSTLNLNQSTDDPSLDLDFDLLFLHDDAASSSPKRPNLARVKSSFTEHWHTTTTTTSSSSSTTTTSSSQGTSRTTSSHGRPPPVVAGRRDWSTFHFSHYASETGTGTGYGGAVGLRGRGRIAEMYTRNRSEMGVGK